MALIRRIVLIMTCGVLFAASAAQARAAVITSDLADYGPGDLATFSGFAFAPGESVVIQVLHADDTTNTGENHGTWLVEADGQGNFVTTWIVCTDDCLGSTLQATALGLDSGLAASVLFTDSPKIESVTVDVLPSAQCAGSTFTFTVTVHRDNAQAGFDSDLTCAGLPTGAACDPLTLSLGVQDGSVTGTLTVTTTTATPGGVQPFTVTATVSHNNDNDSASVVTNLPVIGFGEVCGGTDDGCDAFDTCGADGACVDNVEVAGAVCNPAGANATCDPADTCDGAGKACAPNVAASGAACGGSDAGCDALDTCDGAGACSDNVKTLGAICNAAGASATCDPADTCDGTGKSCSPKVAASGAACGGSDAGCDALDTCDGAGACSDNVKTLGAICNAAGASATCDPADTCDGAGKACAPNVAASGAACGGSDAGCDALDTCDGAGACSDNVKTLGAICNAAGASATCDPADTCDGAGKACAPNVAASGAACGGSDAGCDALDTCDGAGACSDNVKTLGAICNAAGASATCDPADTCDGAGKACAPKVAASGAACGGSDAGCDALDTCDGAGACSDNVKTSGAICNAAGANATCDPADTCDGAGKSCAPKVAASGTACGGSDAGCDALDTCNGSGGCVDYVKPADAVCLAATGECDPADTCNGTSKACAPKYTANGTPCGDRVCNECSSGACANSPVGAGPGCNDTTRNTCTDPDRCDGSGACDRNNKDCVTSSSLCQLDEYPSVGSCANTGACCSLNSNGTAVPSSPACGGAACQPSDQFRLILTPDVTSWPAYKLNGSNPGQFFYNAIVQGPGTASIDVPYPFVTQGARPVHIYPADYAVDRNGCIVLGAELSTPTIPTTSVTAWINGSDGCMSVSGPSPIFDLTSSFPTGAGVCTLQVPLPGSGKYLVAIHLDYGTKGPQVNADIHDTNNPDRFDAAGTVSPWGTYDAFENVDSTATPSTIAVNDCSTYSFAHDGTTTRVQSLNVAKRITGVINSVFDSTLGRQGIPGANASLTKKGTTTPVATAQGDLDGYALLNYKHTGKAAVFTVKLDIPGYGVRSTDVTLKANGWAEVSYDVGTSAWTVAVVGQ